jgi:hypothetical protein
MLSCNTGHIDVYIAQYHAGYVGDSLHPYNYFAHAILQHILATQKRTYLNTILRPPNSLIYWQYRRLCICLTRPI